MYICIRIYTYIYTNINMFTYSSYSVPAVVKGKLFLLSRRPLRHGMMDVDDPQHPAARSRRCCVVGCGLPTGTICSFSHRKTTNFAKKLGRVKFAWNIAGWSVRIGEITPWNSWVEREIKTNGGNKHLFPRHFDQQSSGDQPKHWSYSWLFWLPWSPQPAGNHSHREVRKPMHT